MWSAGLAILGKLGTLGVGAIVFGGALAYGMNTLKQAGVLQERNEILVQTIQRNAEIFEQSKRKQEEINKELEETRLKLVDMRQESKERKEMIMDLPKQGEGQICPVDCIIDFGSEQEK